jgi:hypothetical protein
MDSVKLSYCELITTYTDVSSLHISGRNRGIFRRDNTKIHTKAGIIKTFILILHSFVYVLCFLA